MTDDPHLLQQLDVGRACAFQRESMIVDLEDEGRAADLEHGRNCCRCACAGAEVPSDAARPVYDDGALTTAACDVAHRDRSMAWRGATGVKGMGVGTSAYERSILNS